MSLVAHGDGGLRAVMLMTEGALGEMLESGADDIEGAIEVDVDHDLNLGDSELTSARKLLAAPDTSTSIVPHSGGDGARFRQRRSRNIGDKPGCWHSGDGVPHGRVDVLLFAAGDSDAGTRREGVS